MQSVCFRANDVCMLELVDAYEAVVTDEVRLMPCVLHCGSLHAIAVGVVVVAVINARLMPAPMILMLKVVE